MPEMKLGELLIRNRLISEEQFNQALEMQQLNPAPLGQILCQLGFLDAKDLEHVLDHNKKRRKLGEILIAQRQISEERLGNALKLSAEEGIPLGRALIRQRILEEEQVARAIALQHDLKFVTLAGVRLDPDLAGMINPTFAQRLRIVPIRCRDKCLTIAMANPLHREELYQLEKWCQMTVAPVIAKESDIVVAQRKLYNLSGFLTAEELGVELSEDQIRESGKSKYVNDVISADVDFLVKRLITTGIMKGASDIHLEATEFGMTVRYRIDGVLQTVDIGSVELLVNSNSRQVVSKIKILCDMDIAEHRRPQDSSFKMKVSKGGDVRGVDFRVSTVPTQYGENVVIRILDKRSGTISLEGLGYADEQVKLLCRALEKPTGIFLVTGPTGSGKSSTLYAILSRLNAPGVKTLTIEDPIEYAIDGITQTEVNEHIGNTFSRLLRAFLRQDPDNIMVGEIRDQDTAVIAVRAALTGHTVLSTLHTNDATSAVSRLVDMGVEPGLLSSTLRCVLAQRLVRAICPECRVAVAPPSSLLQEFGLTASIAVTFHQGKGCPDCNYTGFRGRKPLVELWLPTREELLLINKQPDNLSLRKEVFAVPGRLTMVEDGFRRVLAGETTLEELVRVIPYEQIESGHEKIAAMVAAAGSRA